MVICVVALIVIGPEKLPRVARTIGHLTGRLQRYVADVKADIHREVELDELRKMRDAMQSAASSIESTVSTTMSQTEQSLSDSLSTTTSTEASAASTTEPIQPSADRASNALDSPSVNTADNTTPSAAQAAPSSTHTV